MRDDQGVYTNFRFVQLLRRTKKNNRDVGKEARKSHQGYGDVIGNPCLTFFMLPLVRRLSANWSGLWLAPEKKKCKEAKEDTKRAKLCLDVLISLGSDNRKIFFVMRDMIGCNFDVKDRLIENWERRRIKRSRFSVIRLIAFPTRRADLRRRPESGGRICGLR